MSRLKGLFDCSSAAGWPDGHLRGGGDYGAAGCPAHRLREVEQHHVDLRLGYTPASTWPGTFLPVLLATVPARLASDDDRRAFAAWLAGRSPLDRTTTLSPW